MTLKDKLEIGLKEDAPFRKDNLPDFQVRGVEIPKGEGRSPEIPAARRDPTPAEASSSPADALPKVATSAPPAPAAESVAKTDAAASDEVTDD